MRFPTRWLGPLLVILLPLLLVIALAKTLATTNAPRSTIVDQLCPGFTVDASNAILCLTYVDGDSLVWDTQEDHAHRNRIVQLLWFVEQGRLVRADSL